jgi:hypothetical protein
MQLLFIASTEVGQPVFVFAFENMAVFGRGLSRLMRSAVSLSVYTTYSTFGIVL